MSLLPYIVAIWLFLVGLYGIVTTRNLVHMIMCVAVLQSSTYVFLLSIGYRWGSGAPVFAAVPVGTPAVDPVVQALMLTDIVIEATVAALLLSFAVQVQKEAGVLDPNKLLQLRG